MNTIAAKVVRRRLKEMHWSHGRLRDEMKARGDEPGAGLISRWIAGKRMPNVGRAMLMQEILGVEARLWTVPAKGKAA